MKELNEKERKALDEVEKELKLYKKRAFLNSVIDSFGMVGIAMLGITHGDKVKYKECYKHRKLLKKYIHIYINYYVK